MRRLRKVVRLWWQVPSEGEDKVRGRAQVQLQGEHKASPLPWTVSQGRAWMVTGPVRGRAQITGRAVVVRGWWQVPSEGEHKASPLPWTGYEGRAWMVAGPVRGQQKASPGDPRLVRECA